MPASLCAGRQLIQLCWPDTKAPASSPPLPCTDKKDLKRGRRSLVPLIAEENSSRQRIIYCLMGELNKGFAYKPDEFDFQQMFDSCSTQMAWRSKYRIFRKQLHSLLLVGFISLLASANFHNSKELPLFTAVPRGPDLRSVPPPCSLLP